MPHYGIYTALRFGQQDVVVDSSIIEEETTSVARDRAFDEVIFALLPGAKPGIPLCDSGVAAWGIKGKTFGPFSRLARVPSAIPI